MATGSESLKTISSEKEVAVLTLGGTVKWCKIPPDSIGGGKVKLTKINIKEILIEGHTSTAYIKAFPEIVAPVPFDPLNPGLQAPPAQNGIYPITIPLNIIDPCSLTSDPTAFFSLRVHHVFTPNSGTSKQNLCEVIPQEVNCPINLCV